MIPLLHRARRAHPSHPSSAARGLAGLFVASLVLALPGAAAAARGDDRAPRIASAEGALRVVDARGRLEAELPLAEGVLVRSLVALDPARSSDWVATATRGDAALLVFLSQGGTTERLPAPAAGGALVLDPIPLVRDGRLEGLVWLAGADSRSLAVRFAPWQGGAWGEAEIVSPMGPGSQLALAAATTADGTAILAWTAFDGEDDETVWSRREGGRWTAPARVAADNRVPDITPALAPLGDGALLAWSRFEDGEYRLVGARLTAQGWSEPTPLAALGSVFPTLSAGPDGPLLVYRDARRRLWTAARLDGEGNVLSRTRVPGGPDAAPVLLRADAEGVEVIPSPGAKPVRVPWRRTP